MGLFTLDEDLLPDSGKPYRGKCTLKLPSPEKKPPSERKAEEKTERKAEKKKPVYLVTDTSWWLEEGWQGAYEIAFQVPEVVFVLPSPVMKELDGLKKDPDKKQKVFESIKQIERLIKKKQLLIIGIEEESYYNALASKADEQVISSALELKRQRKRVILLTKDKMQKILAEQKGLKTFSFKTDNDHPKYSRGLAMFSPILCLGAAFLGLEIGNAFITFGSIFILFLIILTNHPWLQKIFD